ncbi:hypothetical protein [Aequorivita lipolytica]|uniref:Uncharacterized protein n=1 Tax=Aequorivita lipolytica TaxID=153267 RepID=A0A5C6YP82_9FLAO|nr:hypothetical protein [Aequorivita lipolytica]TXD68863.1 hypothetical protein ESV24_10450 [Aequorivita lipolytica]SRX52124.1 hypothetical protein AEQU2_02103 [Aequorivita lipolytica]
MNSQITNHLLLFFCISLVLYSCQESSTNSELPYEGPPKDRIITVERAQEMYDSYSERRVPIIQKYEDSVVSDSQKFTPTRYAEYDLETIKQYIAYIEHEANQANVDINTLRFYLSNYPNGEKFPNGDVVKYPRRNSFFVVPTMEYEGKNVGFSIEEVDGKYTAVPINKNETKIEKDNQNQKQDEPEGTVNEAGFFTSNTATVQGGGTSLILNESHIMPPPGKDDFGNDN